MSNRFTLVIATPEREVYRDTVDSVSIPTIDGEITVLPGHIPLVATLKPGVLDVRRADGGTWITFDDRPRDGAP